MKKVPGINYDRPVNPDEIKNNPFCWDINKLMRMSYLDNSLARVYYDQEEAVHHVDNALRHLNSLEESFEDMGLEYILYHAGKTARDIYPQEGIQGMMEVVDSTVILLASNDLIQTLQGMRLNSIFLYQTSIAYRHSYVALQGF